MPDLSDQIDQIENNQNQALYTHTSTAELGPLPWYAQSMKRCAPRLGEFITSTKFDSVMGVIIVYNCITIGIQVHMCPPPDSPRSGDDCPEGFLWFSEHTCTAAFLLEWLILGLVRGFRSHTNSTSALLDTFIVWVPGVLLTWIVEPLMNVGGELRGVTALRAFRLLRVIRVARFYLKEIWILFKGLAGSYRTLLSAVTVFVFVNFLFGIMAVSFIGDANIFDSAREAQGFFSGLDQSMFTLLQICTGDSWASAIARPLLKESPDLWLFFVSYVAVASLVLMNLVTAVIVENAIQMTRDDEEQRLHEMKQQKDKELANLRKIFVTLDRDQSGEITGDEFERACHENPDIVNKFKLIGFEDESIMKIFQDLDSGDGFLTVDEFLGGLTLMQGQARGMDLIRTMKNVERIYKRIDIMMDIIDPSGELMAKAVKKRKAKQQKGLHRSFTKSVYEHEGSFEAGDLDAHLELGEHQEHQDGHQQHSQHAKDDEKNFKDGEDAKKSSKSAEVSVTLDEISGAIRRQLDGHMQEMQLCVERACRMEFSRQAKLREEVQHPDLPRPAGLTLKEAVKPQPGLGIGRCALLQCNNPPDTISVNNRPAQTESASTVQVGLEPAIVARQEASSAATKSGSNI